VELGERRVLEDIVHREHAHFADRLGDDDMVLASDEPSLEAFGRQPLRHARTTAAAARDIDGLLVEIGGEDLHLWRGLAARDLLPYQDCDSVGFFAGGAAGHPNAYDVVGRLVVEDPRDDEARQSLEGLRITKELGHTDQKIVI